MTIAICVIGMMLSLAFILVGILDVETRDGETMWIVDYWLKQRRTKKLQRAIRRNDDEPNMRTWNIIVVALAAAPAGAATQQMLEVDFDAGRQVAGGEEYLFYDATVAVDYGRRLLLASEAADPTRVHAFSLDDGSVQGVFGSERPGDGPGELRKVGGTAVGPDGVFVAGPGRVIHWSWSGTLLHQWTPKAPSAYPVCALNGRPVVTLQKGVVFRDDNGESVALGGEARHDLDATPTTAHDVAMAYVSTLLACADSSAYVLAGGSHILTEYKIDTEPRVVSIPVELVEAGGATSMFLAYDGRLVITTFSDKLGGVVMDPETGCYALLPSTRVPGNPMYVGMLADSVVTLEASRKPTTRRVNGKRITAYYADPSYIFVRPVRTVSGEPCS